MTLQQSHGDDSRTVFLVIRGALWGLVVGAAVVVLLELLGVVTGNAEYFGVFVVTAGPPALAAGAIAGLVIALLAWPLVRRQPDDASGRQTATRFAGAATFVLTVGGILLIGALLTQGQAPGLSWLLFTALVVLGIGVPVGGLAMFAAGKVHDVMAMRFPRSAVRR